ncbi:MAG: CHAT domain-containing protein [Coleofasciculaceae cyanobacterium RL_1_1]|nr:CHAT domain-containing protein [Coleofasciculaceae cyanobacterium RL_1_1]
MVYPIIQPDRLITIVALPDQTLRVTTTDLAQRDFEARLNYLKDFFVNPRKWRQIDSLQASLTQIYDWMIAPFEADLQAMGVETLVFVPDGVLRNFPLNALYDGDRYLIERYAIALTPGLQLLPARRLQDTPFQFLTGGLSEARRGFSEIPAVEDELKRLRSLSDRELLNEAFTDANLAQALDRDAFRSSISPPTDSLAPMPMKPFYSPGTTK